MSRTIAARGIVIALLGAGAASLAAGPVARADAPSGCGVLRPNNQMYKGTEYSSCSGTFILKMQADGNVALYPRTNNGVTWGLGAAIWGAGTVNRGDHLVMQGDGNLVIYPARGPAVWASNTGGHAGASLSLRDDGNLVVYDADSRTPLWASRTVPAAPSFRSLGCFKDAGDPSGLSGRDLDGAVDSNGNMSVEQCAGWCNLRGYQYFGLQYGQQCYCGTAYGRQGGADLNDCSKPCAGNQAEKCGGGWRNSVYELSAFAPASPRAR